MSGIQLGAAPRGDDLEKNSGGTELATVAENGEHSGGVASAQPGASVIPELENEASTTPPVADSIVSHQVVIPPVPSAASSGDEDPLRAPLIPKQGEAGDIEQGGEYEEENEALEEIDNVLWIKGVANTQENRCKEALKSWSKKDKLFTSRIDRKRKQSSDFQNEAYQLIGFYSVFQGVLLTAVAQSNLLHCNNTWTASLLSSLASFVTVVGVILKLTAIKELEHTIANEELTRKALVTWQLKLRESGQSFDFKEAKAKSPEGDKKTSWWLNASFLAVIVVLILFSVAFVVSIRQILCNPGHDLLPGS